MKDKVIKLVGLTLLFIIIGYQTFGQTNAVKNHTKLQEYYSFNRWKAEQPKVRVAQAKAAVEQHKNVNKGKKNNKKFNRKIARLKSKIK